jgi:hypothetical protein
VAGPADGSLGRARETNLSGWLPAKLHQLCDDIGEGLRGVDLVGARSPKQRFSLGQVPEIST